MERELIADIVVNELQPLTTALTRMAEAESVADAEGRSEAPGNAAGNAP